MKLSKSKIKYSVALLVVFAMLLQIVGPATLNVYANEQDDMVETEVVETQNVDEDDAEKPEDSQQDQQNEEAAEELEEEEEPVKEDEEEQTENAAGEDTNVPEDEEETSEEAVEDEQNDDDTVEDKESGEEEQVGEEESTDQLNPEMIPENMPADAIVLPLALELGLDDDVIESFKTHLEFSKNGVVIDYKTEPVPADAKVSLKFQVKVVDKELDFPPIGVVDTDKVYEFKVADSIEVTTTGTFDIFHDEDEDVKLAEATINADGTISVRFVEGINHYSYDREIWVELTGKIDESSIGNGGEHQLTFEVDGKTETINIVFEELQDEEIVTLTKKGSYNEAKNEITWTVEVKAKTVPSGGSISNVIIQDIIGEGHEYVKHIIDGVEYTILSDFIFDEISDGVTKTITVITKPDLSQIGADEQWEEIVFKNTVKGSFGEKNTDIPEVDATVKTKIEFINKWNGEFVRGNTRDDDRVKWTIVLNKNNFEMPAGTQLTDDIPNGLKLIEGSIEISPSVNSADINPKLDGSGFTIEFPQGLDKKVTITYYTEIVDTNAYEPDKDGKYINKAKLEWGNGEKVEETGDIGIGRTVIQKSGTGVNEKTREVKWRITVNKDKLNIVKPVVVDTLPEGLLYVSHTANPDIWGTPGFGTDGNRQTVTFGYTGTINDVHTIDIVTRVKDGYENIYGTNGTTKLINDVSLSGENLSKKTAKAEQSYKSQVIAKTGKGYDYVNRIASWEIVVNQNKMPITNAVVTDVIGDHHEFVAGSLKIDEVTAVLGTDYTVSGKTITVNLGNITSQIKITYKTEIPEDQLDELFSKNGTPELENNATLTGVEIKENGVTIKGKNKVNNTVVSKKADYEPGDNFIDWTVEVNLNQIDMGEVTLEDKLDEALVLNISSVKLYKAIMRADGKYSLGEEADVEVDYDTATNNVVFNLGEVKEAYVLKFTTAIEGKEADRQISNTIKLRGTRDISEEADTKISVKFDEASVGGGGGNAKGSLKILKTDTEGRPLAGVSFELLNNQMVPFSPALEGTTDSDGVILYENLDLRTYWIREVSPLDGYKPIDDVQVVLRRGENTADIEVTIENEKIKGSLEILKIDGRTERPLSGAEFTLYDEDMVKIETKITDEEGKVVFEDLEYGKYFYEETGAPRGYYRDRTVYELNIPENDEVLEDGFKIEIVVENRRIPTDPDREDPEDPEDPDDPDDPDEPNIPDEPEDPDTPDTPGPQQPEAEINPQLPEGGVDAMDNIDQTEEDEILEVNESIPQGNVPTLPKTGELNPILFYIAGAMMIGLGVILRRKIVKN